jgi:hypothetical protein
VDRSIVLAGYRLVFALLTIAAMVTQAVDLAGAGKLDPVNFLSYFTIQSNVIAAVVFLVGAVARRGAHGKGWDLVRGGALLYMTVTYVVFALLLSGIDVDTRLAWVNTVVHTVFPLAVIVDWLIDPPQHRISFRDSLVWLVYPLAWTAYTLIRGEIAGWYPYPFLDPANGGYGSVAWYVVGILVFGIVLCVVIGAVGNALGGRRGSPPPPLPA